jgi:hypothetical protein
VTLNSVGFNITRSVGPALGGIIVAAAGAAAAFAVNTLSYFALIYALMRWKPPSRSRRCRARRWAAPSSPGFAISRCRRTSEGAAARLLSSASAPAPSWPFCRSWRWIW